MVGSFEPFWHNITPEKWCAIFFSNSAADFQAASSSLFVAVRFSVTAPLNKNMKTMQTAHFAGKKYTPWKCSHRYQEFNMVFFCKATPLKKSAIFTCNHYKFPFTKGSGNSTKKKRTMHYEKNGNSLQVTIRFALEMIPLKVGGV